MYFFHFVGVDISKDTLDAAIYPMKDKKWTTSILTTRRKASER